MRNRPTPKPHSTAGFPPPKNPQRHRHSQVPKRRNQTNVLHSQHENLRCYRCPNP